MNPIDEALHALLQRLAERPLPEAAADVVKAAFLDYLACLVGGLATPAAMAVRSYVNEQGSSPRSRVFGSGRRASPGLAALANGTAAHALEYDDMNSLVIGHPSVVLIPAVMALGEDLKASGAEVMAAYLQGFEVEAWFGRLMNPKHFQTGWHPTSTIGVMGAAAAAARLMGLDTKQTAMALGIAASHASGVKGNFGAMTKSLHAGHAAERGILSAALARQGFTSSPEALTGPSGYLALYGHNADPERVLADPASSDPMEIIRSSLGFKPYPVGGAGIPPIDAALDLQSLHDIEPEEIDKVVLVITTLAAQVMSIDHPRDIGEGKLSMRFCVAVALVDRKGGIGQFSAERFSDPVVQKVMNKVHVETSPDLVAARGIFPTILSVTLKDGTTRTHRVEAARGHPDRPLSPAHLEAKFLDCAETVLDRASAMQTIGLVRRLDQLPDINQLGVALGLGGI